MDVKRIAVVLLLLSLPFSAALPDDTGSNPLKVQYAAPPVPRLVEPAREKVDLTGKTELVFRWENQSIDIRHFELRIYRGYNLYDQDRILKIFVPGSKRFFKLTADDFETGKPYSWSLVRVNLDGRKSDPSFSSFTVVRR